ncbi:glycosyltransferase family 4 protein [Prevotella intermedia]|uniref:Glycosyltransferase family 1 protein n=1 Tax=Prevotella intermedia TaxID=28131 RepID=A0A2M8TT86_PREIN|nr:glycosyltransferase family 4 protein [Prevotella intermedia]PJI27138.1 glycosyltransferase family 1 protein [Prevotella intermedia]
MDKKKIIRLTTAGESLDDLLIGQLKYLNQYFDIIAVAKDDGRLQKVREREGVRVVDAPIERPISLLKDIIALRWLINFFKQEKPWCVHANTPKGSLLAMIAAWICCVPHRIYTVTGLRYQGATGKFKFILQTMERITCACATKVIPEGQGVLKTLKNDHITSKPLEVILNGNINGKDTSFFSVESLYENCELENGNKRLNILQEESVKDILRKELHITANDFVFIFVGRIVNDKGMKELSKAMQSLLKKNYHLTPQLLLVGDFESKLDPLFPEDENFFKNNSSVLFVDYQKDVRPYLAAADALVFPSYREGFPNVVLEAGCMGLPSIVTDINGCNEIIEEGVNGRIIPPRDSDSLFSAMDWMLTHLSDVEHMASNSRRLIQERFEQEKVWEALLDMYKSLN